MNNTYFSNILLHKNWLINSIEVLVTLCHQDEKLLATYCHQVELILVTLFYQVEKILVTLCHQVEKAKPSTVMLHFPLA